MAEIAVPQEISTDFLFDDVPVRNSRIKDETGHRYGKLTVLGYAGSDQSESAKGGAMWWVRCDCGKRTRARGGQLRAHKRITCGSCNTGPLEALNEAIGFQDLAPCQRGCPMEKTCLKELLGCEPFVKYLRGKEGIWPDPEKYPPTHAMYQQELGHGQFEE